MKLLKFLFRILLVEGKITVYPNRDFP